MLPTKIDGLARNLNHALPLLLARATAIRFFPNSQPTELGTP